MKILKVRTNRDPTVRSYRHSMLSAWVRSMLYVWQIWQCGLHDISGLCRGGSSIESLHEGGATFCNPFLGKEK